MSGPTWTRSVLSDLSGEQLTEIRQRALDLAVTTAPEVPRESAVERRKRILADADAWVKFIIAGKTT